VAALSPDIRCIAFGHLADGNIHIMVSRAEPLDVATRRSIKEAVYAPLRALGGSISAEHGVGLEKKDYMSQSRSAVELSLMRSIKVMLDQNNILNPGKVLNLI